MRLESQDGSQGRAKLLKEGAEGGVGQLGGVVGGRRQAADGGRDRVGGEVSKLVEFPSLN